MIIVVNMTLKGTTVDLHRLTIVPQTQMLKQQQSNMAIRQDTDQSCNSKQQQSNTGIRQDTDQSCHSKQQQSNTGIRQDTDQSCHSKQCSTEQHRNQTRHRSVLPFKAMFNRATLESDKTQISLAIQSNVQQSNTGIRQDTDQSCHSKQCSTEQHWNQTRHRSVLPFKAMFNRATLESDKTQISPAIQSNDQQSNTGIRQDTDQSCHSKQCSTEQHWNQTRHRSVLSFTATTEQHGNQTRHRSVLSSKGTINIADIASTFSLFTDLNC